MLLTVITYAVITAIYDKLAPNPNMIFTEILHKFRTFLLCIEELYLGEIQ